MSAEVEAPGRGPRDVQELDGGGDVAGVSRSFGPVAALAGVSLRVPPRRTVAVVGPSGCGKSTLLELVVGLQAPDEGPVRAAPAALMPQHDGLLPWLSALDNAGLAMRLPAASKAAPPPAPPPPPVPP